MTSPYISREAGRLKIITRDPTYGSAEPARTGNAMVSAHAEYRRSDYRFARQQSDAAPLERSRPIESVAARLLRMAVIAFIFASAWAATGGIVWVLTSY